MDTCPGFVPAICQAFLSSVALGYPDPATVALLRSDSMVSYWRKVHVPVLLAQGEHDSLFNIQEAVDNLHELQANGDPVTLVLQSWGHSNSTPAPGELSSTAPYSGYENVVVKDFFDKWLVPRRLQGQPGASGAVLPPVGDLWARRLRRPGLRDGGLVAGRRRAGLLPVRGRAAERGGTSGRHAGTGVVEPGPERHAVDGRRDGVPVDRDRIAGGVSRAGGAGHRDNGQPRRGIGTSYSETSGMQTTAPFSDIAPVDLPGTTMSWTSPPLAQSLDVVGVPTLRVTVASAVPGGLDPATDPVAVAKLYDVSPSGTVTLVDRLVSPVRIASPGQPVTITLPGQVHQYAAGDRLELVLAAGDLAYLGNRSPGVLSVSVGGGQAAVLSLPVVAPADQRTGGPMATGL